MAPNRAAARDMSPDPSNGPAKRRTCWAWAPRPSRCWPTWIAVDGEGNVLGGVPPGDLAVWLTEPTRAPHGGESVVDLMRRVARWLDSLTGNAWAAVAVTHPAVIRAAILLALDAPPKSFWRIDIAPVSRTVLHSAAAAGRFAGDSSAGAISAKACLATCSIQPVTVGPW